MSGSATIRTKLRRNPTWVALCALGLVVGLCVLARFTERAGRPPGHYPLRLRKMSALEAVRRSWYSFCEDVESKVANGRPDVVTAEPNAASQYPLYGVFVLGAERPVVFRLDESKGTGEGYDRLIVDWNANGDLRDDFVGQPANRPRRAAGNHELLFGPFEVAAAEPTHPGRCRFYVFGGIRDKRSIPSGKDVGGLELIPGAWLETTVVLNGIKQKIGILDSNCSAAFGETTRLQLRKGREGYAWHYHWGDVLLRDRDGSGRFDLDSLPTEAEPLSRLVYFGSKPYTLELTKDLRGVRIAPYSGQVGSLSVGPTAQVDRLLLCRAREPNDWELVAPGVVDGLCEAPPGQYNLVACVVRAQGKNETLSLMATLDRPKEAVRVKAGQTSRLVCGAPLSLRVEAKKSANRSVDLFDVLAGDNVSKVSTIGIAVDVLGTGEEKYEDFLKTTRRDRTRPDPPLFKVLDESGTVIGSGRMKYG